MKVKLIYIFLSITSLSYGLKSSHHYKFKYLSNFETGIPHNGNQVNGFSMKAFLDVYLENDDGIALFKLSDITTVAYNEDYGCDLELETELPDDRFQPPEDKEFSGALELPFRANLRGSEPFSIEYEETEHRWLSNVQKGIASIFKNEILKGNFATQEVDSISSLFHEGHLLNTFSIEEETIFGICKAKYHIHKINDHSISIGKDILSTPPSVVGGSNESHWRVVRSLNFDKCKDKVSLHFHTKNEKRSKREKLGFNRASVSTYVLRGSPGHFDLYGTFVDGLITFPVSNFDDHEAQVTTTQKLLLIDHTTNEEVPTLGSNLKHSTTWMHQVWSSFTPPKDSKPLPWVVYTGKNSYNEEYEIYGSQTFTSKLDISKIKIKILEIIETSSKFLTDINYEINEDKWKHYPDSLNIVSHYMKLLTKKDIIKILDHIFERKVKLERRLIIDAVAASGSHNAFEAILDFISEDKLESFEIRNAFMTLSSSDGTLNITRLLDYVLQVDPRRNSEGSAVWLSFAHYLSEFCIHKAHNYVPVKEPFKEECVPVTKRFILHLKEEMIYNETLTWERAFGIRVLETLRTFFSFDILSPLIDGRIPSSNEIKSMALRALKNWAPDRDQDRSVFRKPVKDLLEDVFNDFNQDFGVRAAALVSYLSWQPSTSFWYDLAHSTWRDPSKQYSSFVSHMIKYYAEQKVPALEKQWRDASLVLKYAKAPSQHTDFIESSLFDIFFKKYAKLFALPLYGEQFVEILTKVGGRSLFKVENYLTYEDFEVYSGNRVFPHGHLPEAKKFFDKFMEEIKLENPSSREIQEFEIFFQFLSGTSGSMTPRNTYDPANFVRETEDRNIIYGGRYFNLFEKTDFFPNELGLPTFTYSSMPTIYSLVMKRMEPKSGEMDSDQLLIRASTVYTRGVSVYLPWSKDSVSALVGTSFDLTLPIGYTQKTHTVTEGISRTSKISFYTAYEKKFPVFSFANTPLTVTFNLDPKLEKFKNFQWIKKYDIKKHEISEVHSFTGIKYGLSLEADSKTPLNHLDFKRLPKNPFGVWFYKLYLNPEESETKELVIRLTKGILKKPEEVEGSETIDSSTRSQEISFNDTFTERSEKLIKSFESSVEYNQIKFDFMGEKERSYEIFIVGNESKYEFSRMRIGFASNRMPENTNQPISICLDFDKRSPSYAERDTTYISHRSISQEAKLKILFNCNDYILNSHALYTMSEEGRIETTGNCNDKYDNTEFNPEKKLFYDNIDIDTSIPENIESYDFGAAKDVFESLQNWVGFSSIKKYTDESHIKDIGLRIHRNSYHKNWDFNLKTSSGDVLLTTFSDTSLFRFLLGVSQYPPKTMIDHLVTQKFSTDDKCTLQGNSVTTFDGVKYTYEPSNCWTLVTHSHPFEKYAPHVDNNAFFIRASQGRPSNIPDFKYTLFQADREIEFSNGELKINGTVVDRNSEDSPELKTIEEGLIYKSRHTYLIYIPHTNPIYPPGSNTRPTVVAGPDKIDIYFEKLGYKGHGLCGNNDGKRNPEFIGPKQCNYKDAQMFAASWTGHSDICEATTLEEYRKEADHFQAECKPYQDQPQDVHLNQRCLFFGWKTLESKENNYCISTKPLPFCLSTCRTKNNHNIKVTYKCWPKEKAPEFLRTSIENKVEIVTDPIAADPYSYEHFSTEIAKFCKQI